MRMVVSRLNHVWHTVFDEVEAYATDNGHFVYSHGTKKCLNCDFFIGDFCGGVEDIVIGDLDDFGFQSCLFCSGADIEVFRRQHRFTPQFAAVSCDEADESIPVGCHDEDMICMIPVS